MAHRPASAQTRQARPRLEALEERSLPSATLSGATSQQAIVRSSSTVQIQQATAASAGLTFTNNNDATIPGKGSGASLIAVSQSQVIKRITVSFDIVYPKTAALRIYLQAPNGTLLPLVKNVGSGANFHNTILDDKASTSIYMGRAPFTGTYQPINALATFNGLNTHGNWKLWVETSDGARGVINTWSITFNRS